MFDITLFGEFTSFAGSDNWNSCRLPQHHKARIVFGVKCILFDNPHLLARLWVASQDCHTLPPQHTYIQKSTND